MRRPKNILVGVDGFGAADHALKQSMHLARWAQGRVTVITVAPPYEGDLSLVGVRSLKAAIDGPSAAVLARAVETAGAEGMEIDVICEEGEAHERIAERAGKGGFDLVVLGRERGRTPRQRIFGSLCARLAPLVSTDILVIPVATEISWERSFYLDWLSPGSQETFSRALNVCAAYGSELHSARTTALRWSGRNKITYSAPYAPTWAGELTQPSTTPLNTPPEISRRLERSGDPSKQIGSYLRDNQIGVFLFPYRVSSGIGGWRNRRFLESMIAESPCPIMVLTENR